MIDTNGGGFIWVHRAWGPFVGWVNGWNGMMSSYINIGLLITLFPSYFPIATDYWEGFGLSVAFVVVTIFVNIVGFRWVSRISGLIMVFLFLPFFCALGKLTRKRGRKWFLVFIKRNCFLTFNELGWEIATGRVYTMDWGSLAEIPAWDYVK